MIKVSQSQNYPTLRASCFRNGVQRYKKMTMSANNYAQNLQNMHFYNKKVW